MPLCNSITFALLMMALTPKRLFLSLSLCISISLLRPYTFFLALTFGLYTLFENACELQRVVLHLEELCPSSVADSWCGWQPAAVQAGSDEEYVHLNIMPEAVFEVIKLTDISLTNKALLQRCLRRATQSKNEAFNAIMIWNVWPKQGFAGAEVVELPAHLIAARFINHRAVTFLAVLRKMGCTAGSFTDSYWCATGRCLKSQKGWSQGW